MKLNNLSSDAPVVNTDLLRQNFAKEDPHLVMHAIHANGINAALARQEVKNNTKHLFPPTSKQVQ